MSYRSNTQDSTKKWLLAVGAAGLISAAAAAAYFLVGRSRGPTTAHGRTQKGRAKAAGRSGARSPPTRPGTPQGPIKLPSMRFFSRPEGPPGASQPGDPLGVPADYHDLTLSPVWWYTRLFDLFDCDLDELKTLHMAIRESGRNPTVSGPDGQETLYIPTAVIHRAIELARQNPEIPVEHVIILYAMCGHDAESTKEKITSYEAAYELWKNHPLRKKKRVMEMFFLMALAQATSEDFERSTGLLGRLRKLATDTYGEHSLQVVSVEREAAVALHLAKRNDEAETLLLKCMKQEEELIPSTDVGRFHILLTGYISVTRFFARIGKYAEAKKYSENIIRQAVAFRGMSEAWSSIDYALEIIGQLSKASGVRLYLARKWASTLEAEGVVPESIEIIKLNLHMYSAFLFLGQYQAAVDAITTAEKEIINLPPQHRGVQGIVLGMNKAIAVVQGGIADLYEEAQQHLSAAMQLSKMLPQTLTILNLVHWMALMDNMNRPKEAEEIRTLLPADMLGHYKTGGIRGLWELIIGVDAEPNMAPDTEAMAAAGVKTPTPAAQKRLDEPEAEEVLAVEAPVEPVSAAIIENADSNETVTVAASLEEPKPVAEEVQEVAEEPAAPVEEEQPQEESAPVVEETAAPIEEVKADEESAASIEEEPVPTAVAESADPDEEVVGVAEEEPAAEEPAAEN